MNESQGGFMGAFKELEIPNVEQDVNFNLFEEDPEMLEQYLLHIMSKNKIYEVLKLISHPESSKHQGLDFIDFQT